MLKIIGIIIIRINKALVHFIHKIVIINKNVLKVVVFLIYLPHQVIIHTKIIIKIRIGIVAEILVNIIYDIAHILI